MVAGLVWPAPRLELAISDWFDINCPCFFQLITRILHWCLLVKLWKARGYIWNVCYLRWEANDFDRLTRNSPACCILFYYIFSPKSPCYY
ncbi:hypothetical protein PRUPE_1G443000 [Prunus persica]|uniref:Uncharacterized protein n=1 Tax=Prunus persica TaxID=3760 RepID=A0A251RF07_PRUPE|nr:hypothetical protein PRUPE_1G443000 [Prunus persica]